VLSGTLVAAVHVPVLDWQWPGIWHVGAVQTTDGWAVQTPPMQSCGLHLSALHIVPSMTCGGCAGHAPVVVLQVPVVWHGSVAGVQVTAFNPVQTPPEHWKFWKHLGPVAALHGVLQVPQLPLSLCRFTQVLLLVQSVGRLALLHEATHEVPLHLTVPLVGRVGHIAQTPLQSSVPVGQLLQTPPLQLVPPAGHLLLHVPQLFLSIAVSTSHPSAGLLSQSAIGALQVGEPHLPATQPSTPPVMLQACPHAPQFPTLVFV
jgi:hypothetical protein